MSALERLNVGLVGAVGRGRSFAAGFEANGARIHAVCDELLTDLLTRERSVDRCQIGCPTARFHGLQRADHFCLGNRWRAEIQHGGAQPQYKQSLEQHHFLLPPDSW